MLIAHGDSQTGPVMIFGLDANNVRLLKEGKPILRELAQFGGPNLTVLIMYGNTLDDVQAELGKYVKLPPPESLPKAS